MPRPFLQMKLNFRKIVSGRTVFVYCGDVHNKETIFGLYAAHGAQKSHLICIRKTFITRGLFLYVYRHL